MILLHQDLVEIVEQSSTLTERLSADFSADPNATDPEQIRIRLDRWCQSVAQGQWHDFEKRLAWDNLSLEQIRPFLSTSRLVDSTQLPPWTQTLKSISQTASDLSLGSKVRVPFKSDQPVPFEDLLLPFIIVARNTLRDRIKDRQLSSNFAPCQVLSDAAYLSFERQLLGQLINIAGKTLHQEFAHFRPVGSNLLTLVLSGSPQTQDRKYYNTFVNAQRQNGFVSLFKAYPVLARLMAMQVDLWVEATAEFIGRVQRDLSQIYSFFQDSECPLPEQCRIREIKTGLSDAHHRGRSVIILTLETGLKLVYKPKALDLEVAYNRLLSWCNHQNKQLNFKVVKILNRQDYGWMEYVHHRPCNDEAAVHRFYWHSGMLLYLLALLGSTDCHHENLIANGEHLVLIDVEAIMQPIPNAMVDSPRHTQENTDLETSTSHKKQLLAMAVLGTGLLPRWSFNHNGRIAYDTSALGSPMEKQVYGEAPVWKYINTDKMHLAKEQYFLSPKSNIPLFKNQLVLADQYLDDLEAGFRQMHSFCLKHQAQWLSDNGPLSGLHRQRVRFIFRATRAYGTVLNNSLLPHHLRDGIDRSIEIERLGRAFIWTEHQPKTWPLFAHECHSIEHLDIPYFDTPANTATLCWKSLEPIEQYFRDASADQVRRRLQALEDINLEETIALIRGSFYARAAHQPKVKQAPTTVQVTPQETLQPLSPTELCHQAQAIAQKILDKAILKQAGESVYWLGYHYFPAANRFQMQSLNSSFYNGNCGIALFLAALDWMTEGQYDYRTTVMKALNRSLHALKSLFDEAHHQEAIFSKISRVSSMGASLYGLVRIARFLNDQTLMDDASRVASLITPERVATDMKFEVANGIAGTLLGLLVLYQETGDDTVLNRAIFCGQHLIKHQKTMPNGSTWSLSAEQSISRFAHGTLGIAYALLRLYRITQDSAALEAAQTGWQYEQGYFTKAQNYGNFDSQDSSTPIVHCGWDYGACGCEFAQLGCSSSVLLDQINQDIEGVIQNAQRATLEEVDSLPCGNFARIDFLLTAANQLAQPPLQNIALQQATQQLNQAERVGGFQLFANLPCEVFNPSLFYGTAGIGYELLRLAYPERFPSILLWQ